MAKKLSNYEIHRKASKFIKNFDKSFFYAHNYKNNADVLAFKKCFYGVKRLCEGIIDIDNVQDEVRIKTAELFKLKTKIINKINLYKTLQKSFKDRVPSRFDSEKIGYSHSEIDSIRNVSRNIKNKNK